MAPKTLKRKSDAIDDTPATPTGSPSRKKLRVTAEQKQAIIDNLQLEITERARKLRAGYALQCEDLRARVQRRVNRIPMAMRKMTMGELMARHAESGKSRPASPELGKPPSPLRTSPVKARKRKSSHIQIALDHDNDVFAPDTLPVAKKTRAKNATAAPRATSRAGKPVSVLSPRSHNSRTLPQSPFNSISPMKAAFSRPVSPLKPASPFKTAASAATSAISASMHGMIESTKRGTAAAAGKLSRTASREKTSPAKPVVVGANTRGKMLPPARPTTAASSPQRTASQSSNHTSTSESSAVSSGTTVVKPKRGTRAAAAKPTTAATAATRTKRAAATTTVAATKSTAASAAKEKVTGTGLRGKTASKKVAIAEPAGGRRVLRKRE
ncbi:uncharacterized protein AB675_2700 [Cyphellophora attinorum]|uniref:Borealin N-terminal domain-containing protein n=1 Tax=Cyphellophora attinorum TaxID=1664694 RepID=A0A0N1P3F6_9EURO|nr:uncharacterized protein AB675_2700 [Phialophora attinorum]KPI45336.1 hypothetical protein AB675_2700 [Phialophora attinorum]